MNYLLTCISNIIQSFLLVLTQSKMEKSNVLENTNKQLTMKRDKDVYLKTIAEITGFITFALRKTDRWCNWQHV